MVCNYLYMYPNLVTSFYKYMPYKPTVCNYSVWYMTLCLVENYWTTTGDPIGKRHISRFQTKWLYHNDPGSANSIHMAHYTRQCLLFTGALQWLGIRLLEHAYFMVSWKCLWWWNLSKSFLVNRIGILVFDAFWEILSCRPVSSL